MRPVGVMLIFKVITASMSQIRIVITRKAYADLAATKLTACQKGSSMPCRSYCG